jgi:hypothetical protein
MPLSDADIAQMKAAGWQIGQDRGISRTGQFVGPPASATVTGTAKPVTSNPNQRAPLYNHPSSAKMRDSQN